jgi:YggT family protein
MSTLLTTISILVNLLILALIMKLTLKPREFYFNPYLRPVEYLTDPIIRFLSRFSRPTRSGKDFTPLLAILGLVIIQMVAIFLFTSNGFLASLIVCVQRIISMLLQFISVCVIVTLMVPAYGTNPLIKFLMNVLQPFIKVFAFSFTKRHVKILAAFVGIIIMGFVFWHLLLSIYLHLVPADPHPADMLTSLKLGRHIDFSTSIVSGKIMFFSLGQVFTKVIAVYKFIVFLLLINCILSWIDLDARNPAVQFVFALTEPILAPVRRLFPTVSGFDFSPIVVVILLSIIGFLLGSGIEYLLITVIGG